MKRICPFEDLQPQIKVHVGQKQINNGVSSDERMKNVYDRTLSLLKAGAKALTHKMNMSTEMDFIDLPSPQPQVQITSCKLKYPTKSKQMILTNKLQLMASDKVINDIQVDLCGCCRIIDRSAIYKCYYCDQILCSFCLSTCTSCSEMFCRNCCLSLYNYEEQNICFKCNR